MGRAIAAARRAFDETDWSTDTALRVRCIRQLQQAMRDHIEELRELTIAEVGAPRMLTSDGATRGAGRGSELLRRHRRVLLSGRPISVSRRRWASRPRRTIAREAVGVVGAITPWNFPHQINLAKIGPALAAGNTVVLKPAPDTPWCAAVLGELITEHTDFPAGVVNIVTSSDHGVGALLSKDPRVDMVSFTGSTATGRAVMADGAATLKKVFLELGGKSAFLVLDDADLAGACAMSAFTASMHAGQGCAITTRLVVPRDRYDEAVEAAAATMGGLKPGDPTKPGTICGPLISARQRDRVQGYLDSAIGGRRPIRLRRRTSRRPRHWLLHRADGDRRARQQREGRARGDLRSGADGDRPRRRRRRRAHRQRFAVRLVRHGVLRRTRERAAGIAARLRVGTVNVNGGVWYSADMPFGGYKQSGIGREMGLAGFEEYLETKAIATAV